MTTNNLRTYGGTTVHIGTTTKSRFVTLACQPKGSQLKSKFRTVNREAVTCKRCEATTR